MSISFGTQYTELQNNLRLAINRLKLLKKKKTELAQKSRKEIAEFIAGNTVIREDYLVEAFELLEMHCDLLLARFGLIQQMETLDEGIEEAVISLLWAAPRLLSDVQEFKIISDQLTAKYGKPFAEACGQDQLNKVNPKLLQKLGVQSPPKILVEKYMIEIAKSHGVPFTADTTVIRDDEVAAAEATLVDFQKQGQQGYGDDKGGPPPNGGGGGGGMIGIPPAPPLNYPSLNSQPSAEALMPKVPSNPSGLASAPPAPTENNAVKKEPPPDYVAGSLPTLPDPPTDFPSFDDPPSRPPPPTGGAAGGASKPTDDLDFGPLVCHECPKDVFANTVELELHVRLDHIRYIPYECTECPYVRLPTEVTTREHFKIQHPEIREPDISYTWNRVLEQRVKDHVDQSLAMNADRVCDPEVQLVRVHARPLFAMTPMYAAPAMNSMPTRQLSEHRREDETRADGGFCVVCQVAVEKRDEHCYDVHFERGIFSCPMKGVCYRLRCATRAEMEQHIADEHDGIKAPATRNGNYIRELTKLLRLCFPTPVTMVERAKSGKRRATTIGAVGEATSDGDDDEYGESPTKKPKMIVSARKAKATPKALPMHTCRLCEEVVNIKSVRLHIVKRHLQKHIKVCSVCSDKGTYGGAAEIERHIRKVHSDDEKAFVMNMTDIYASDIGQFYEQCFPNVKPILPRQTIG